LQAAVIAGWFRLLERTGSEATLCVAQHLTAFSAKTAIALVLVRTVNVQHGLECAFLTLDSIATGV
jgi:hypothetical protein